MADYTIVEDLFPSERLIRINVTSPEVPIGGHRVDVIVPDGLDHSEALAFCDLVALEVAFNYQARGK